MTTTEATISRSAPASIGRDRWASPLELNRYDQHPDLTVMECRALVELGATGLQHGRRGRRPWPPPGLERLAIPLVDALACQRISKTPEQRRGSADAAAVILLRCHEVGKVFWGWSGADWAAVIGSTAAAFKASLPIGYETHSRAAMIGLAYLLGQFNDFHLIGKFNRKELADRVFGVEATAVAELEISTVLAN